MPPPTHSPIQMTGHRRHEPPLLISQPAATDGTGEASGDGRYLARDDDDD